MQEFNPLQVQNITRETPTSVSITFSLPDNLKQQYTFTSGQYVSLEAIINNEKVRRSYSLCSISEEGLTVGIKLVENGVFSSYANKQLQVGDTIQVSTPEGNFKLEPKNGENYMAIAAGSGITPIFSMVKETLQNTQSGIFHLLFGNQSQEESMFGTQLEALQTAYPNRLYIQNIYSREKRTDALAGRIDRGIINYSLKKTFEGREMTSYYLCGPEKMIQTAKECLQEKGVKDSQVHDELFTSTAVVAAPVSTSGISKITMIVDDEEHVFEMKKSQTILDAALKLEIDAPYSCRGGVCSSCIALIEEGTAQMAKNTILVASEIEQGLTLCCQAHPTSDAVTINFDEV